MKIKLVAFLALMAQFVFAQKTLVAIPGTKCSMLPPEGFTVASNFAGFQNSSIGASIMVAEIPAAYDKMVNSFTKEELLKKGMTLIGKETVAHQQGSATIIQVSQEARDVIYLKQILIFGDQANTVIVNGIYPESQKEIAADIKTALLSTVYNAAQKDDPLGAAIFTIDTDGSDLVFTKFMSGGLLYTVEGKIPTKKPMLIVTPSLSSIPAASRKKYAEDRVKALPGGEKNVIKETNEISIDNMNGYEIIANGETKDGTAALIYQVMLYNDKGNYFLIVGQSAEDTARYLAVFKAVAKTFRRK